MSTSRIATFSLTSTQAKKLKAMTEYILVVQKEVDHGRVKDALSSSTSSLGVITRPPPPKKNAYLQLTNRCHV